MVSNTTARWPRLQEYQAAIINAETTGFKDRQLRGLKVERHPVIPGVAWARKGAFGAVFKVTGNSAEYAVKVCSIRRSPTGRYVISSSANT